jgi:hypothetical protein
LKDASKEEPKKEVQEKTPLSPRSPAISNKLNNYNLIEPKI